MEDLEKCPTCGSELKEESDSLHVVRFEYECGYTIVGAIDTETHGDGWLVMKKCEKDD